ncbi:MAG: UDP-3-O-acyl-N-acetylglucosamine deacetylase [Fibrobacter sp.]|jgi:UDP-3-O-[3-hydroxymyristoyl] N-acetylglucosamine deacetylase|nr:UDP-3-O-acyl-N-acetylglucosamine deacetylase [Fibrobacter sp.]
MPVFSGNSLSHPLVQVEINGEKKSSRGISWYSGTDFLWNSHDVSSFLKLNRRVARTTIVEDNRGHFLATPEHLTPVLLLYAESSFQIRVLQNEFPLFDGSAFPWFQRIRKIAGAPQTLYFYDAPLREKWEWETGFCEVSPAETFEAEYSVSNRFWNDSAFHAVYDAEDLLPVFQARTFIFEEEYLAVKSQGLLAGADTSAGLLLKTNAPGEVTVIHGGKFRSPKEMIYHKILDLVGDVSLPAPFLPRLRIRIHNGGHTAHHQLLERLLPYVPFRNVV